MILKLWLMDVLFLCNGRNGWIGSGKSFGDKFFVVKMMCLFLCL